MSGNFNPAYYSSAYDGHVVDLVFQSLIKKDKDDNWVPDAARTGSCRKMEKPLCSSLKKILYSLMESP